VLFAEKPPHPSPLPEGEGTDRVVLANYIDLRLRGDLGLAKPEITLNVQVGVPRISGSLTPALSLRERAGRAAFR